MLSASHAPNLKVDNTLRMQLWVKFLAILRAGGEYTARDCEVCFPGTTS